MTNTPTYLQHVLRDLLILSDSVELYPWRNLTAIFGDIASWNCRAPKSEYSLLDPYKLSNGNLLDYIAEAYIPTYKPKASSIDIPAMKTSKKNKKLDKEEWFFINGVATNKEVAKWNGERLVELFHRPITLLHNPTDTLPIDLLECILDRTLDWTSDPVDFSAHKIKKALKKEEKEKIVVITHSQGSIIISRVLKELLKEKDETFQKNLKKLEIYTFACPADEMVSMEKTCCELKLGHIEHFANTHDLVAKLGILRIKKYKQQPDGFLEEIIKKPFSDIANGIFGKEFFDMKISGKLYIRKHSGHLLNAHYLDDFSSLPYKHGKQADAQLYKYLGGKTI